MRTTILGTAVVAAAALALTACGGSDGDGDKGKAATAEVKGGRQSGKAISLDKGNEKAKPDLVLTDTDGKKYDLIKETKGRPTLLFFGYTHCPDVCPLSMSNLGIAEKKLSKAERDKLRVVFVTTDPARDTPKRIRSWLNAQGGTDFVGLTGEFDTIQAAARTLGIYVDKPKKEKDGSITVGHGAEVVGYAPQDNKGHWIYTTGTTAEQYTKDLPKIVKGQNP
ncbi:SCO family protein [Streptomyces sp. NA02950]|uniref:SCO family protein n=1 Tax=Streptomyces sp. NA02950 TaxID=2742137 RepID=UPI001590CBE3|nr:SCO family protein [Streptomyces sp. NA02950]QKV93864.1 SCO family protein [Streptomyces sp. NA02950]